MRRASVCTRTTILLYAAYTVQLLYFCHLILWVGVEDTRAASFRLFFYNVLFSSIISQFRSVLYEIDARRFF
jgi:hypothetical protein